MSLLGYMLSWARALTSGLEYLKAHGGIQGALNRRVQRLQQEINELVGGRKEVVQPLNLLGTKAVGFLSLLRVEERCTTCNVALRASSQFCHRCGQPRR